MEELLKELEKDSQNFWNISRKTAQFLFDLILKNNYKTALEIGTSNGYSGIWLAKALEKTGGHLYTIESNAKKRYRLALENFKKSGLTNITPILGHAPEAIPPEPKTFDFAFFDATKNEHLLYFNTLKNRINKGGIIITDNINSHRKELSTYIETLKSLPDWESREINIGTGLLLSKKL